MVVKRSLVPLQEMMNGSSQQEAYIGHDAQQMRGVLALRYPMKNGVIHNWDDMEKVRLAPSVCVELGW